MVLPRSIFFKVSQNSWSSIHSTFKKKERENIEFELESKLTILYQNGGTHEEEISKLESELKKYKGRKSQRYNND
jgi:hypothetical protein